jgi:hypothetical protein
LVSCVPRWSVSGGDVRSNSRLQLAGADVRS